MVAFIFAWDLGVIFLGVPILWSADSWKKFFLNFGLKGVTEKCMGCFLVYLYVRVCVCARACVCVCVCVCDSFKIALLPYFNN